VVSFRKRSVQRAHEQHYIEDCTEAVGYPAALPDQDHDAQRKIISYRGLSPRPDVRYTKRRQPQTQPQTLPQTHGKERLGWFAIRRAIASRSVRSVWPKVEVHDAQKTRLILLE